MRRRSESGLARAAVSRAEGRTEPVADAEDLAADGPEHDHAAVGDRVCESEVKESAGSSSLGPRPTRKEDAQTVGWFNLNMPIQ